MRFVLCDTESSVLEIYKTIIENISVENDIEADIICYTSVRQLLFEMEEIAPSIDVLLLDIAMPPGMGGLQAAKKLRTDYNYSGEIIFTSPSDRYAIDAFDVRAFHYIVKNVTPAEIQKEILKSVIKYRGKKKQKFLLLKGTNGYKNILINSIVLFEAMGRMIKVYYGQNETFEFVSTFASLESKILPYGFIRVHKSYLVAINKIISFSYEGVKMKTGQTVPVGRKYLPSLKKVLYNLVN
ncbi:MAG: LytR/AlgR family response regulator transcription factor [Bacillota bacterium]|jgi:two-component system response regulator LytT